MRLYQFLKAAFIFARHQAWVDAPKWEKPDAQALANFLVTPAGARLKAYLVNAVLCQQAKALNTTSALVYEAGYCAGQRGLVASLEAMANSESFSEPGDTDADPATHQEAS